MGVPCISLGGDAAVSRAGKSILHAANLAELASDTPEQFVAIAAALASDVDRLKTLRAGMRERLLAASLLDHGGFAARLEAAYRQAWREWCAAEGDGRGVT